MSSGKSSRPKGSRPSPDSSNGDQGTPSRPFALPLGYYDYYGIPLPKGAVQAKRSLYPGKPIPHGYLEHYGIVQPARPDNAESPAQPNAKDETVQAKSDGTAANMEAEQVHDAATRGTSGPSGALPCLDDIQKSFGKHDVSQVKAHTDGHAAAGAQALAAEAFTTGNHVAFAGAPSLHTAAHEAAHVVQQRAGFQLKAGIGEVGDAYEKHADRVADAVIAGRSAESLLDESGRGGSRQAAGPVSESTDGVARKAKAPAVGPPTFKLFNTTFEVHHDTAGQLTIKPKGKQSAGWSFHIDGPNQAIATRILPHWQYTRTSGQALALMQRTTVHITDSTVTVDPIAAVVGDPPLASLVLDDERHIGPRKTVTVGEAAVVGLDLDATALAALKPIDGDTITLGGKGDAYVYTTLRGSGTPLQGFFHVGKYVYFRTEDRWGVTNVGASDADKEAAFDRLVASGAVSADEAPLFKAVSIIESDLAGVQNYDRGILSFGFAQWTVPSDLPKMLKHVPQATFSEYLGRYGLALADPKYGTHSWLNQSMPASISRKGLPLRNLSEGALWLAGQELVAENVRQRVQTAAQGLETGLEQLQHLGTQLGNPAEAAAVKKQLTAIGKSLRGLPGVAAALKVDSDPQAMAQALTAAATTALAAAKELLANTRSLEALRSPEWVLRFELLGQDKAAQAAEVKTAQATLQDLLGRKWAGAPSSQLLASDRSRAALLSSYFNTPAGTQSGLKKAVTTFAQQRAAQDPAHAADWNKFPWPQGDARWASLFDGVRGELEALAIHFMTEHTHDPDRRRRILADVPN